MDFPAVIENHADNWPGWVYVNPDGASLDLRDWVHRDNVEDLEASLAEAQERERMGEAYKPYGRE